MVQCPLCDRSVRRSRKLKPLNGVLVCPKCRNGFANRRQAAYIVDFVLLNVVSRVPFHLAGVAGSSEALLDLPPLIGQRIGAPLIGPPPMMGDIVPILLCWVLTLAFYLKDGFGGQSPGKALFGVQVVDSYSCDPIGFWASFKRNLVLIVPFAPPMVAFTLLKGPRWGDGWARTTVIWKKYRHHPVFDPRGIVCMKCGYDLTGNVSGRCPECFTPIPPGSSPPSASPAATPQPASSARTDAP